MHTAKRPRHGTDAVIDVDSESPAAVIDIDDDDAPAMRAAPAAYGPVPVNVTRLPPQQQFQAAYSQIAPPGGYGAGLVNPFEPYPVTVDVKPTAVAQQLTNPATLYASSASNAIDLTNEPSPPPPPATAARPPPPAGPMAHDSRKPICMGSIDTQALILYPTPLMQRGQDTEELRRVRQVRVDQAGEEWLHVKCKYRRLPPVEGSPPGTPDQEQIIVLNMAQTVQVGLLNDITYRVLSPLMQRSLIRVEGYIKRGDTERMFTAALNLLLFTLPANVEHVSKRLVESSIFLDVPLPYYDPNNHADMPVYVNPHNPPEGGFRARGRRADTLLGRAYNGSTGSGGMTQQKAIEVQRQQVDEVFRSLKGHDELAESEVPRDRIKTKLFPHQRKAITFLLQREAEPAAIKAAVVAAASAALSDDAQSSATNTPTTTRETTPAVDSNSDSSSSSGSSSGGDRKQRAAAKKERRRKQKEAEKEAKRRGFNSLWEPLPSAGSSSSFSSKKGGGGGSGKVRRWKNRVTAQIAEGKHRPEEARGSILADDMGLGKTLTTISLIASTLSSARKYARQGPTDYDDFSQSDEDGAGEDDGDSERSDLDASHFAGAVHGMPSSATAAGGDKKRKIGDQQVKFDTRKIARLERRARLERIQLRSRGTLLICPLSTVTNWEDQIREHWNGNVYVEGGHQTASQKRANGDDEGDYTGNGKPDLRVFIYHGASRKVSVTKLADFDIVITTFNVLQTEYSKQLKTAEGISRYKATTATPGVLSSNPGTPSARESDDEDSTPMRGAEKAEVTADRKRLLKAEPGTSGSVIAPTAKGGKAKTSMVHGFDVMGKKTSREIVSPLQSIEWFRVVLDEAHFIKDPSTIVSRAASYLEAERRLCLTGTPIQNKVEDVWALLKFLRLKPFDDRNVWQTYIMSLAKAGNSLGVVRLQTILRHCTLRRTKDTVSADGQRLLDLPPRVDRKVEIELSPDERAIYDAHFLRTKENFEEMRSKKSGITYVNILQQILRLRQICDHWTLIDEANVEDVEEEIMDEMDMDTAKQTILQEGLSLRRAYAYVNSLPDVVSASDPSEASCCFSCQVQLRVNEPKEEEDEDEEANKGKSKKGKAKTRNVAPILTRCCHLFCQACFKREVFPSWPNQLVGAGRKCPACDTGLRLGTDVIEVAPGATLAVDAASNNKMKADKRKRFQGEPQLSSKMRVLLMDLLQISKHNPHSDNYDPSQSSDIVDLDPDGKPLITKSVVFSQWTTMLDHIENMLSYADIGYSRLDGTMKREARAEAMDALKNDPKCEVLLVSLRAGGVGLNLTTASRAYLIDPYWNPSVENQAIDRIHRLGQTRSVTSIKYVVKDSIEEKMLKVQQRKSELVKISLNQSVSKKDLHERRLEDLKMLFS